MEAVPNNSSSRDPHQSHIPMHGSFTVDLGLYAAPSRRVRHGWKASVAPYPSQKKMQVVSFWTAPAGARKTGMS